MRPATERSYRWLFWCLALVGFAVDQGSKYTVFARLHDEAIRSVDRTARRALIPGAFWLTVQMTPKEDAGTALLSPLRTWGGDRLPYVNRGALFGLGNNDEDGRHFNLEFLVVSLAAALAIIFWSSRPHTVQDRWLCVALGLILAGTLGNLYDRVVFSGVRDFLHWDCVVNWPVFNLADCCLVSGASLLLLQALVTQPQAASPDHARESPAVEPPPSLEGAACRGAEG